MKWFNAKNVRNIKTCEKSLIKNCCGEKTNFFAPFYCSVSAKFRAFPRLIIIGLCCGGGGQSVWAKTVIDVGKCSGNKRKNLPVRP